MRMTSNSNYVRRSTIARSLGGSFAASFAGRIAKVAMGVLLARQLSPDGYGAFAFAVGSGQILARVGALGWPTLMARFVPRYCSESDWGKLRGLIRTADEIVGTAVLLLLQVKKMIK